MLRILWQHEHYPDPVKGGGGSVNAHYLVKELQRLTCDPVILAGMTEANPRPEECIAGIRVLRLAAPRLPDLLWPLWPSLLPRALREPLRRIASPFDAFVCTDAAYALSLKRGYPERPLVCRVVGTTRGYRRAVPDDHPLLKADSIRALKTRLLRRFLALQEDLLDVLAWRRADGIVVQSQSMKLEMSSLYRLEPAKIHVIPSGVDHERFAQPAPGSDLLDRLGNRDRSKILITYCGRLVKMKNVAFLIHAYRRMRRRGDCRLIIVGEGDQRLALSELARQLDVESGVLFAGPTDRVEEYLAASDIFVLPSTYEPFGNALVEAMAAGLPCLALRPDGLTVRTASAEIIADGVSGYLVDGRDPGDLAAKLDLLCQEPSLRLRLGQAGRRIAAERFSWRRCAEAYLELLQTSTHRFHP